LNRTVLINHHKRMLTVSLYWCAAALRYSVVSSQKRRLNR